MKQDTEPAYKPGTVLPSSHNPDGWTFDYWFRGMIINRDQWTTASFPSATEAKNAMRGFIKEMNKQ